MRTNPILRIVLFSIALIFLLGVLGVGLGVTAYMTIGNSEQTDEIHHTPQLQTDEQTGNQGSFADSEVYSVPASIRELGIEWAAGTITIAPSPNVTDIQVSENFTGSDKYKMVCRQEGNKLDIRFSSETIRFPSFGVNTDSKDLVILVPSDWTCDALEIDAASADVYVSGLTISQMDFDGASGICNLENCTVYNMDVDAASGEVIFSGHLDCLDFDGASGDCTLKLTNCPSSIDLDGMSGDLDITLPSDCGFIVNSEGLSSDFTTDFDIKTINGAHCHGDGSCRIEVDALSGRVCIRDGGYNCHATEDHGHHGSHH